MGAAVGAAVGAACGGVITRLANAAVGADAASLLWVPLCCCGILGAVSANRRIGEAWVEVCGGVRGDERCGGSAGSRCDSDEQ